MLAAPGISKFPFEMEKRSLAAIDNSHQGMIKDHRPFAAAFGSLPKEREERKRAREEGSPFVADDSSAKEERKRESWLYIDSSRLLGRLTAGLLDSGDVEY